MSVECTSCGHLIPAGQFRCGKCGGLAPRESLEDFGGLTEVVADGHVAVQPPVAAPAVPAAASGVAGAAPGVAGAAPGVAATAPAVAASSTAAPGVAATAPAVAATAPAAAAPTAAAPGVAAPAPAVAAPPAAAAPLDAAVPMEPVPEPPPPVARLEPPADEEAAGSEPPVGTREYAVPKGTFASEIPRATPLPPRNPDASGELKTVARDASQPLATAPAGATGSAPRPKEPRAPARPPFLASEILREDLMPLEPGKRALNHVAHAAAVFGLIGSLLLGYDSAAGVLSAIACAGLIALARIRLEYATRAAAIALLAGTSLVGAVLARLSLGASNDDPVLAAACVLLPAALLFRAWYRASQAARAVVAASLVFALVWAAMTSHRGLLTLGFSWQSWLPALAWYLFGILCLLSLLAFMADETTGGCGFWALGLLAWYELFGCLRAAMEMETFALGTRSAAAALSLAETAFAAPLAVALAQLYARALTARRRTAVARG